MGSTAGRTRPSSRIKDYVTWFEIPVHDIQRASTFYNTVYGIEMEVIVNGEFAMAYFPAEKGVGGALIWGPGCVPNDTGTLIYLNAGGDLPGMLARVEMAGGRVIMPRTLISEAAGHFALIIDSEGNRLALHEAPSVGRTTRAARKSTGKRAPAKAPARSRSKRKPN